MPHLKQLLFASIIVLASAFVKSVFMKNMRFFAKGVFYMQKKIGIIGAMQVEVDFLLSKLEGQKNVEAGGLIFAQGILEERDVVIVRSGIGKVNAALCAQRLIMQFGVTHIINTGIAGAMAEGLGVLDFVVSSDALYHDFDVTGFGYKKCVIPQMQVSTFAASNELIDCAKNAFEKLEDATSHKIVLGRIASGDQFISSAEQKNIIRKDCAPSCVEMEGAAIAHACYLCSTPFVIIRCMSDMADDKGESSYDFNEATAATMSASLVCNMLKSL